jgi:serine/threonine-protein kinase HipA
VIDGRVHRLHQESLASLCGLRGFGVSASQQTLLKGLRAVVSDPLCETIEFLRRDVLNLAMRNTDNHAGQLQALSVFIPAGNGRG